MLSGPFVLRAERRPSPGPADPCALDRAVDYANEREVFDQPIGAHPGVQHPIADAYSRVQAVCNHIAEHTLGLPRSYAAD